MKDDGCSIRALLEAISRELGALGATMDRTQEALSPVLSRAVLGNPLAMTGLQELDRLTQTLHALSAVAARLADATEPSRTVDSRAILAAVPLGDLAKRLGAE